MGRRLRRGQPAGGGRRRAGSPVAAAAQQQAAEIEELPNRPDSLKFAVIGDNGTGATPQYDVASRC